jgi:hypothetical protein
VSVAAGVVVGVDAGVSALLPDDPQAATTSTSRAAKARAVRTLLIHAPSTFVGEPLPGVVRRESPVP